jgi:hypothetical protein
MESINSQKWLYQGIVLASIPASAYLLAFLFEFGHASTYNIPVDLISLSPTQFCIAFIAIVSIALMGFYLFNTIFKTIHQITHKHRRINRIATSWSVWIALAIIFTTFAHIPFRDGIWFVLILVVFLAIVDFALIPFAKWTNLKLNENDKEFQDSIKDKLPISRLEEYTGVKVSVALTTLFVLLLGSFFLGISEATRKDTYMVSYGEPSVIVLRIYDGNMIVADFDPETKNLDRNLSFVPVGSTDRTFVFDQVGKLNIPKRNFTWAE